MAGDVPDTAAPISRAPVIAAKTKTEIAADFDAIARLLARRPDARRLTPAERTMLPHIPRGSRTALDVGCGDGVMARALAEHGMRVTAIDLSSEMIALARKTTPAGLNIRFATADFTTDAAQLGVFDVVVCVNVVHHLPLVVAIPRLQSFVAPGGVLLIQDVVDRPGWRYLPVNAVGLVASAIRRIRNASQRTRDLRHAYAAHGRGEKYLTPDEAAMHYQELLPESSVQHHVEWRYTAVWHRPPAPDVNRNLTVR